MGGRTMPYDPVRRVFATSTYRDFIEASHMVTAHCCASSCQHNAELDLNALAARFGMDAEFRKDLLRCSRCGSRNVQVRISFDMVRAAGG
jgi:hypothetical protein